MTRKEKWQYKRYQMKKDRDDMSDSLLDLSEKIMKTHSDIVVNSFNRMFDDPIEKLNEIFMIGGKDETN